MIGSIGRYSRGTPDQSDEEVEQFIEGYLEKMVATREVTSGA